MILLKIRLRRQDFACEEESTIEHAYKVERITSVRVSTQQSAQQQTNNVERNKSRCAIAVLMVVPVESTTIATTAAATTIHVDQTRPKRRDSSTAVAQRCVTRHVRRRFAIADSQTPRNDRATHTRTNSTCSLCTWAVTFFQSQQTDAACSTANNVSFFSK